VICIWQICQNDSTGNFHAVGTQESVQYKNFSRSGQDTLTLLYNAAAGCVSVVPCKAVTCILYVHNLSRLFVLSSSITKWSCYYHLVLLLCVLKFHCQPVISERGRQILVFSLWAHTGCDCNWLMLLKRSWKIFVTLRSHRTWRTFSPQRSRSAGVKSSQHGSWTTVDARCFHCFLTETVPPINASLREEVESNIRLAMFLL